jgi:condensin complex subunit 3
VIEIIRRICNGERDFAQVIMEIVYDLHDILNDDVEEGEADTSQDSFVSALSEVVSEAAKKGRKDGPSSKRAMTPEEEDEEEEEARAVKELMINLKCLHIAQCMLQNVQDVSHSLFVRGTDD